MDSNSVSLVSASDSKVTIALSGRVTADNAPAIEKEISALRAANPQGTLTLAADALDYISSAGLRIVMRLLKSEGSLTITDVSKEVYDVFEMTGLTARVDVQRRAREISVEGCEGIGQGGFGTV